MKDETDRTPCSPELKPPDSCVYDLSLKNGHACSNFFSQNIHTFLYVSVLSGKRKWVINEEEAETVREIYRLFLEGLSGKAIANRLTAEGKPTPGGQKEWNPGTVNRMLQNEKYKGNTLLQIWVPLVIKMTPFNDYIRKSDTFQRLQQGF